MAETTATTALFRDASARIFATRLMQAASPTDVPPNFITCKGLFIFSRIRRNSIGKWLENRPSASKGASKNYTLLQRFCAILLFHSQNEGFSSHSPLDTSHFVLLAEKRLQVYDFLVPDFLMDHYVVLAQAYVKIVLP